MIKKIVFTTNSNLVNDVKIILGTSIVAHGYRYKR